MKKSFWLVKQEPSAYSWEQFRKDGKTDWTGVRNFQARNHLRSMKKGDRVLFYHSVTGKCVVGEAEVEREHFQDPTSEDPRWSCVTLRAKSPLKHPVSLDRIKTTPELAEIGLLKQSRLSVMPLSKGEFDKILDLSKSPE